jgi:transposase-like protein
MPAKKAPTGTDRDLDLATLSHLFVDEDAAREFLECRRWPDGVVTCPHCDADGAYRLSAKPGSKRPVRPGVFKCRACRKQFTVRVGTIFEDSKIQLSKWVMALHLMTSSKKGISSHQMARELGTTVKSGWFVTMRIREAMRDRSTSALEGTVEIDECYVGGKPRPGNKGKPGQNPKPKRGRGTEKQPVMVLVERGGKSRAMPIGSADGDTLIGQAKKHVASTAAIVTDEWSGYRGIGQHFDGGHKTVNHSQREYVRYEDAGETFVSTNTAESWFALLKRAFVGIHHKMSKTHLHRYCDERSFMWGNRGITDGERMVAAIEGAEGKRLMYR